MEQWYWFPTFYCSQLVKRNSPLSDLINMEWFMNVSLYLCWMYCVTVFNIQWLELWALHHQDTVLSIINSSPISSHSFVLSLSLFPSPSLSISLSLFLPLSLSLSLSPLYLYFSLPLSLLSLSPLSLLLSLSSSSPLSPLSLYIQYGCDGRQSERPMALHRDLCSLKGKKT